MKFEVTIIKKHSTKTNIYTFKNCNDTNEAEIIQGISKYFEYIKTKLDVIDYKIKRIE